ncbi:MAG: ATP-dependent DNA helicase RecG [Lachnospiraceae bacterium]|nr:ATP-dependent DNA helicase RecG [Lachnospiraceae bacterium]
MKLTDDIKTLKGVGEKTAQALAGLGIYSINDLLHHFPRTYERLPEIGRIADTPSGGRHCVDAVVSSAPVVFRRGGRQILQFSVSDGSGEGKVSFFGMPYLKNRFRPGSRYIFYAYTSRKGTVLSLAQPRILSRAEYEDGIRRLSPVYPLTADVTMSLLRKLMDQALPLTALMGEYLPAEVMERLKLMPVGEAIRCMHAPESEEQAALARRRMVFEEFFLFLARMELLKSGPEKKASGHVISGREAADGFTASLPYDLTGAQERAVNDILSDMGSGYVMNRLLQGDVGSGKTAVAFSAAAAVIASGERCAVMAPTEVLARQHYEDALRYCEAGVLCTHPVLLTGSLKASEKKRIKEETEKGEADLIIGTHAIIQEDVHIPGLGLIVTDEQHRFGVAQRMSLADKGEEPHVLVMSATPIPRTLALILYGDMDVSVIDEKPAERLPVKNAVVDDSFRVKNLQFILKRISEGRQAYIICPQVEEGVSEGLCNVEDYTAMLREKLPPAIRVDMLHGKMKPAEKNEVMERFASGKTDILVSTTVVEVGVNVPNAVVMMVENAERFGLSQLHQLRGRVGRGEHQSYCIFVTGENAGKDSLERLNILKESNDGFRIAEEDLKQRGPGDFFGSRQSGLPYFEMADIYADSALLTETKQCLSGILSAGAEGVEKLKKLLAESSDVSCHDFHGICL